MVKCSSPMLVSSPAEFAAAVAEHPLGEFTLDPEMLARAASTTAEAGLLMVGERHGVRETPGVLYALAVALGTRALALEWSHEEMDEPVRRFLSSGRFDFERLWALPASAEFFYGDGRSAAGNFALLHRLLEEGRLDQVVCVDRLGPEPAPDAWQVRDREMATRLLSEWDQRLSLLVLTGGFHAQLDAAAGETMAARLARERPGLQPAMLAYTSGYSNWRGELHAVSGPFADAPIILRLPKATPAVLPSRGR